jgi:hypothetical protein
MNERLTTWIKSLSQSLLSRSRGILCTAAHSPYVSRSIERTLFDKNSNMLNSTYCSEQCASVLVHQAPMVFRSNEIMLQDLFVLTCYLSLGICVIFPFVTRFRLYIAQCSEALEWLFHGPQLLAKRYVSAWNLNNVLAAVLTRQPGSWGPIQHQNTNSRIPSGIFAGTHRRNQSSE